MSGSPSTGNRSLSGRQPGWGLGEVAAGIFSSLFLSTAIGGLIIGLAGWSAADSSSSTGDGVIPVWGLALLQIPLWAGYLGAVAFAGRAKGDGIARDFGLSSTAVDVPIGLVIGVVLQLIVLPVVYWPIFELTGTDSERLSEPARELASRADSTAAWMLFALMVGVGAPFVEELFYRGLFLRALVKRGMGEWVAVLVSAAVFASVHFQVLQFPGLLVFGLVAGALAVRTARLGPAIWAHVGFNLSAVGALYLSST